MYSLRLWVKISLGQNEYWAQKTAPQFVLRDWLLQGGRKGSQALDKFVKQGAGSLNNKDQVSY